MSQAKVGTFCWSETMTTDTKKTKDFYKAVFGWEFMEMPMPSGPAYTMWKVDGFERGGIYELSKEQRAHNVPPHWSNYLFTDNVDKTTTKAESLGATVLAAPLDVADVGRMSVLKDITGAQFCLWQDKGKKPVKTPTAENVPGTIGWHELMTDNIEDAGKFYCDLFGWNIKAKKMNGSSYFEFLIGKEPVAGMVETQEDWGDMPSNWMPYLNTNNCETTCKKITKAGGKIVFPTHEVPKVGNIAVAQDSCGAYFALVQFTFN